MVQIATEFEWQENSHFEDNLKSYNPLHGNKSRVYLKPESNFMLKDTIEEEEFHIIFSISLKSDL